VNHPNKPGSKYQNRRRSRELAMRLLFQFQSSGLRPEEIVYLFEQNFNPKNDSEASLEVTQEDFDNSWPMARELFLGAAKCVEELDRDIQGASKNWSLDRMSQVDLALLRLAYYEMLFRSDIPLKVSLDEAIEIAKSYGDQDSTAFINGILDKLLAEAKKKSTAQG
jgi:N utilization substance protein B